MAESAVQTKAVLKKALGWISGNRMVAILLAACICVMIPDAVLALSGGASSRKTVSEALPLEFSEEEENVLDPETLEPVERLALSDVLKPMMSSSVLSGSGGILAVDESSDSSGSSYTGYSDYADNSPSTTSYTGTSRWIQIPNSYINSAIAQGTDNSFYLTHNIYGAYDWRGCIYANSSCNMKSIATLSQNTVLFGHNKATNRYGSEVSNFTTLPRFQDYSFAANHRFIYLSIGGETAVFVVFAAFDLAVREESSFPYWYSYVGSDIISGAKNRSYWNYGVDVTTSDHLITLSTCSYDWGYDANYNTYAKFVVMGRMLRSGETTASFGGISANTSRRTPAGLSRVQN